ncbi:YceI family protein [Bacteriovorax sp. PP10]|uniref:YceI family protein n=1 Tax=Bacteriovorax antarcticus TaxID=3088717 RepID=A0ABU5VZH1_9BACT|nr:YceI family protein [Bacteriovorax sp. PP10]MEA9358468.1 YceI family protein [Bacteriovorax sp. PP10]
MKHLKSTCICIALIYSTTLLAQAEKITVDTKNSTVEFLATGSPSAIKIKGEKAKVDGDIKIENNKLQAILKVDLNSFETGMEMRDEHMKENYLQTDKAENKFAQLEIQNLNIPIEYWKNSKELRLDFSGELTLHNVKKSVAGKILFPPFKKDLSINTISELQIKLSDYLINIPSFAGITVAENVSIIVKLPMVVSIK